MPSSQQWKKGNGSAANGGDDGGFSLEQGDNGAANAARGANSHGATGVSTSLATGPYTEVTVSSVGGMTIDLDFVSADHPTANFEADVERAALVLSQAIHNNITVNLTVGYGEVEGTPLTNGSAAAGPDAGLLSSYSTVRAALISHATPGDPNISDFNSLPTGSSIQGYSQVEVWSAEAKALGLMSATNSAIDGSAGFAVGIPDSLMVGVAVHELTHALGRVPDGSEPDIFDLSRFTSSGTRLVSSAIPSAAAYFSVNGGQSALASYGTQSDPSDFLNASAPNDPFDEFYNPSTIQGLTNLDLTQMDVLGFNVGAPQTPIGPTVNVRSFTVAANTAVGESAFVTGVTNPSNDSITRYAFRNAGTDGHLTSNGTAVQNGQWITVAASSVGGIGYVGGATSGNDTLQVEVLDATTATWSTPSTLTATTYAPHVTPTVDVRNFSLRTLSSVGESAFFTGMSNPSGDSITAYAFWDAGGANGHLTVGGVAQKDGQWNVVGASQLGSVGYASGAKAGGESLFVEAYDATTSSWTAYTGLTATTYAPIMRTTELFTNAIASMTTSGGPNLGASIPTEPPSSPVHLASAH